MAAVAVSAAVAGGVRSIRGIHAGIRTSDGAGVALKRVIGGSAVPDLDPFLLLDEFKSENSDDYISGFPDHPHRGFETVTYMLEGAMEHRDHSGNVGYLGPGSVQWMTAGSGIVHSEMPKIEDGLMWGFQLWVNLPAAKKMCKPRYQDIPPADIPVVPLGHSSSVRVLAGSWQGVQGPVKDIISSPLFLDVRLDNCKAEGERATFVTPVKGGQNVFLYVYDGTADVQQGDSTWKKVSAGHIVTFDMDSNDGSVAVSSHSHGRFLVLSATPWGEPIARHGPFVMNTRQELAAAFQELRNGTFLTHYD